MKLAKGDVEFEHPAKGAHNCGGCVHFEVLAPRHCEIVSGTILAQDWCDKWSPKMKSDRQTKSPSEINKDQSCEAQCGAKAAQARSTDPDAGIKEHGLHVTSRTTGKTVDVGFGPQGGGLVPKNPFASLAQAGYMHAHPEILGKTALDEWDASTKGKHLPKKK